MSGETGVAIKTNSKKNTIKDVSSINKNIDNKNLDNKVIRKQNVN